MNEASERAEKASLLVWLENHPSYVLNGGDTVRIECAICGDLATASGNAAICGIPCVVCGATMQIVRFKNAIRSRKAPYTLFVSDGGYGSKESYERKPYVSENGKAVFEYVAPSHDEIVAVSRCTVHCVCGEEHGYEYTEDLE